MERESYIAQANSIVDTGMFISNPDKDNPSSGTIVFLNGKTVIRRAYTLKPGEIQSIGSMKRLRDSLPKDQQHDQYQIFVVGDISVMCCWCNTGTLNFFAQFMAPKANI